MNQSNSNKTALIMAGGTGGHVFPALAVAEILRDREIDVHWLGTAAGIEAKVIPAVGIRLHCIEVKGVRGKGKLGLLKAPFLIVKAIWQARKVFKTVKPDVVLGMGGFASGPGAVAAKLAGVPLVIHEQNAKAGMTNKLSLLMAKRKLAAFPGAFGDDVAKGIEVLGNPVRGPILQLPVYTERYNQRTGSLNVLVIGGSLGAAAINKVVPQTLKEMSERERPNVWHQTGVKNYESTNADYLEYNIEANVAAFIDDMHEAYRWADLIICRSGALTVSEIAIAGVASVLVPFPFAVDDHQTANGKYLENADAAILVQQNDLTVEKLTSLFKTLNNREKLMNMAGKALSVAAPNASVDVANVCLEEMK